MYLEQIHEANDIKKLNERELAGLAEEIRTFLVEKISKTGGHLPGCCYLSALSLRFSALSATKKTEHAKGLIDYAAHKSNHRRK